VLSFQTRTKRTSFIRGTRALACLVALAITPQVSLAQTSPAFDLVQAQVAVTSLIAGDFTQQLAAQRQFVSNTSAMQQENLRLAVFGSGNVMGQQTPSNGAQGLFAIRIAEFAQTRGALMSDYSQNIRQRRLDMAAGVIELANDRTLMFLETGFMLAAPNVSLQTPLPPLPRFDFSFPEFASLSGGFFSRSGN